MSTIVFDKILKIIQLIVTILQFALKAIYGDTQSDNSDDDQ